MHPVNMQLLSHIKSEEHVSDYVHSSVALPVYIILTVSTTYSRGLKGSRVKEQFLPLGQPLVGNVELCQLRTLLQSLHHRYGIVIQIPVGELLGYCFHRHRTA